MEIDYSRIPEAPVEQKSSYRPPRHVFFDRRDPETGMMVEEPKYVHQDYPRMMYKREGEKIVADVIHDDTELTHRLNSGWVKNPGELGYLTAPSFEETLAMRGITKPESKAAVEAEANIAAEKTEKKTNKKDASVEIPGFVTAKQGA